MNQEVMNDFVMNIQLPVFAVFAVIGILVLMWKMLGVIFIKPWKQGRKKSVIAYVVSSIVIGIIPMMMSGGTYMTIALIVSMVSSMIVVSWYTIWVQDVWTDEDKYAVFVWYVMNPYVWVSEQIVMGAYNMYDSWKLRK